MKHDLEILDPVTSQAMHPQSAAHWFPLSHPKVFPL